MFLALLVVALVIVGPILAIAAFVRASRLRDLVDQVPRLTSRIYELERRLASFEQAIKGQSIASSPPAQAAPIQAKEDVSRPAPLVPQQQTPPPVVAVPAAPVQTRAQFAAQRPQVPAQPAWGGTLVSAHSESTSRPDTDVETMIAGHWFYYAGILALALAATFFLKYAFDNNWIGPTGRVGIGLLVGSALFPLSHWILKRGYKYFSEGIAGLGATILYLSIWAGWHYYRLFGQETAFGLMIVVTAVTTVVAIGRNSERIAVLALIGGALTPTLVSTGQNAEVVLFTYLLILGAGMLGVAWQRTWKSLPPLFFVAMVIYFWGWYFDFYRRDELSTTLIFAAAFFALFATLPAIRSVRDGELSGVELGVVIANALQFLIALRMMLWPEHRWELTLAVLTLAALHLMAERMLPKKDSTTTRMTRMLYAGLALTFATLAVPIRLDGHWITLAWATEGLVVVWCGLRLSSWALRGVGLLMFFIVAIRLVAFPIEIGREPTFLLNARFLTMTYCAAAAVAAFVLARRSREPIEKGEAGVYFGLAIAADVCFLVAISWEVWDMLGRTPSLGIDRQLAQELGLSMLWAVYSLAQIIPGLKWKSLALRWQGLVLMAITIAKVFLFDLSFLDRFYRIVSFFALGIVLLGLSFLYQQMAKAADKT